MKPYFENDEAGVRLYHAACEDVLPLLPRFDLLLTDPPYGLGEKLRAGEGNEWSGGFEVAPEWDTEIIAPEVLNLCIAKARAAIVFGGNYYPLPPVRGWIAWDKMQDHTSGHFELAWTNLDIPTRSFRMSRVVAYSQMKKEHPTQKPLALMEWCIEQVADAQTILDPFAGSGTTLVAALRTGRHATGIEREEKYCEIAARRIEKELAQGRLFEPQATPEPPKQIALLGA